MKGDSSMDSDAKSQDFLGHDQVLLHRVGSQSGNDFLLEVRERERERETGGA